MAGLLRTELVFRRSLLAGLRADGLVTVPELMSGWTALNGTVSTLAQMTGSSLEELIVVTDEERARSRELAVPGADEFGLVAALALDPWNTDAQGLLGAALAPPPALEGVRSFAVLAYADELAGAPEMLIAYGCVFNATSDVTLVVVGSQFDALAAALDRVGLAGDDGPDLLAVEPSDGLARAVNAVYSRESQSGALAAVPRVDEGRVALLSELAADAQPDPAPR
jgi:hypothetical protein